MRIARALLPAALTAALLISPAVPASASAAPTRSGSIVDLATQVTESRLGAKPGYSAAATGTVADPLDTNNTNDIVSTSLRFDTNLINVSVTTRDTPVIDETSWLATSFSFNGFGYFDGIAVYGKLTADSPAETVAINRWGMECHAMTTVVSSTLTTSIDAACMGHPGSVSYSTVYGNFYAALDTPSAVDSVPDAGFTAPVNEEGGYWLLGADGGVFSFGSAAFYGSTGNLRLNQPVVSMSAVPGATGYRFVASDGGVFSYGSATFLGSMGGSHLNKPVVGMATTKSGNGYWLVASDGGIFAYGDARFYGSMGGSHLNEPIVGMAPTPSGNGYWLVASDGGIFAYGDAGFYGSTGSLTLNLPITSVAVTNDGRGYNLLAADGGVFSFGNASFRGSAVGSTWGNAVSLAFSGNGYLIADEGGAVHEMGDVYNFGDLIQLNVAPNKPIVAIAIAD